jgi:U3 small nucleolar RNA-associated protein 20
MNDNYINLCVVVFKLVSLALRCICRLLRMPLPSIEEYAPKISTSIFTLLHKYSGNASGDTFEMIQTAFKVNNNYGY